MHATPGWMHAVYNNQPNWKISWEYHEITNFPAYAQSALTVQWRHGKNNRPSYMHTNQVALDWLEGAYSVGL